MNTLQKFLTCLVAFMAIASLSACGTQPGDRALSGTFLGAAAGGAVFALFPGTPITLGLATGGALGAIAGGLSLPEYLYLGEPAWKTYELDPENLSIKRRPIPENPQMGQQRPQMQQQMQQQQQPAR